MLGTGNMPLKRQTSFPLMEGNFWLRKAGSKRVDKQSIGLEGFSEEVTVKQRPEERKGWALGEEHSRQREQYLQRLQGEMER